jgi:hypothetical protein
VKARCAFSAEIYTRDAVGSHACSLEANVRVINSIPLGCQRQLPLTGATINRVETRKARGGVPVSSLPKELRHPNIRRQEQDERVLAKRAKMKTDVASLSRLTLLSAKIQETAVCFTASEAIEVDSKPSTTTRPTTSTNTSINGSTLSNTTASVGSCKITPAGHATLPLSAAGHIVIVLPHAHVTPDEAVRCIRFSPDALAAQAASDCTVTRVSLNMCARECAFRVLHACYLNANKKA